MKSRMIFLIIAALLAVTLMLLYFTQGAWMEWKQVSDLKREVKALRQMEAEGDPRLAETLDRSLATIPAGQFLQGSELGRFDERPQRLVFLDAFSIDRYEVTNLQYKRFVDVSGRPAPGYWQSGEYPDSQALFPVVGVSWQEADAYCRWVGKRLPTEAEWEKACRGVAGRIYPWGDGWDLHRANLSWLSPSPDQVQSSTQDFLKRFLMTMPSNADQPGLRPVGSYPGGASHYGVFDLVGNASEWVADWYNWADYSGLPAVNPFVNGPSWSRCVRGSAWLDPAAGQAWVEMSSRCSARNSSHVSQDYRIGFRCAWSVPLP